LTKGIAAGRPGGVRVPLDPIPYRLTLESAQQSVEVHADHGGRCVPCRVDWPCESFERAAHTVRRLTEPEWMGWASGDEYERGAHDGEPPPARPVSFRWLAGGS
jgi:hypothetical protein